MQLLIVEMMPAPNVAPALTSGQTLRFAQRYGVLGQRNPPSLDRRPSE